MSNLGKKKFLKKLNDFFPIILLYIAVLNEFDFNYLNFCLKNVIKILVPTIKQNI